MLEPRKNLLSAMTREAGSCLKQYFGGDLSIRKKGELDLVTLADTEAEKVLVNHIVQAFPHDGILAEEGGCKPGTSGYEWIIDPLDGTTNFTHQFPHFSVSVALAHEGSLVSGIVFDPAKDEWFEAHRGGGAWLNGQPVCPSTCMMLNEALTVTGYPYDRRGRLDRLLSRTGRILQHTQGLRRLGSAALDLAYVACGRFDAFVEDGLNAWDMAAGQLLVLESGGRLCRFDGGPFSLHGGEIVATNPHLQGQVLQKITLPETVTEV